MMRIALPVLALWLLLIGDAPLHAARAASIDGVWMTAERRGVIQIARCPSPGPGPSQGAGGTWCGWVVGVILKPGEKPPQTYQHQPQCGFNLIRGMRQTGPELWSGEIVNPEDGASYHSHLAPDGPDQLRLRGYVGLPIFGRTTRWTRYRGPIGPDCRAR